MNGVRVYMVIQKYFPPFPYEVCKLNLRTMIQLDKEAVPDAATLLESDCLMHVIYSCRSRQAQRQRTSYRTTYYCSLQCCSGYRQVGSSCVRKCFNMSHLVIKSLWCIHYIFKIIATQFPLTTSQASKHSHSNIRCNIYIRIQMSTHTMSCIFVYAQSTYTVS